MLSKEQVTEIENILKREGTAAAQARVNDLLPSSVSDQLKFTDPKMIFVEAPAKTVDALVTKEDRAPYMVAAALAFFLWLTVFSGAYMLLTSMLEEKLNKLLEMMLASTRFAEIIFGKLLGVAALTLTAMAPYIILGCTVWI